MLNIKKDPMGKRIKMLKMILATLVATVALTAGGPVAEAPVQAPVQASPYVEVKNAYAGVSGQVLLADRVNFFDYDVALTSAAYGVGAQAGYTFYRAGNVSLAAEGRYTYSWADRTLGDTGVLSGFLKPSYDTGVLDVYALLGYSSVEIDVLGTSDGFAWGLGAGTDLNSDFAVFIDYTVNPEFENGFTVTEFDNEIVTVGLSYKF